MASNTPTEFDVSQVSGDVYARNLGFKPDDTPPPEIGVRHPDGYVKRYRLDFLTKDGGWVYKALTPNFPSSSPNTILVLTG
jgi:hypothetical protein